ncbi:Malate dehydrogenase [Operophtera brumata]|uniref:Malate dehydrogenase n=1 Tax=Operophtera brumata TaxID=104452 RepID=A0A0L7L1X2_OPEBR|nr:Malate dehydrogenase [Operophtera brumata]
MPEVKVEEVRRFMEDSFLAVGTPEKAAKAHAALLLHADTAGHFSHGINRLEFYINDILSGFTKAQADPAILKESAATALVDGCDALGATVGHFCIDLAMKKAREAGVALVTAKQKEGLIGLAFTNTSPIMVPTRAKYGGAPNLGQCFIVIDPSHFAPGFAERMAACLQHWRSMEPCYIVIDPSHFAPGYVERMAACLQHWRSMEPVNIALYHLYCKWLRTQGRVRNLGQCIIVIDPSLFAPGFADRMAACLQHWRSIEPVNIALYHLYCKWLRTQGRVRNLGQCIIVIDPSHFAPGFADRMAACLQHWRSIEPVNIALYHLYCKWLRTQGGSIATSAGSWRQGAHQRREDGRARHHRVLPRTDRYLHSYGQADRGQAHTDYRQITNT